MRNLRRAVLASWILAFTACNASHAPAREYGLGSAAGAALTASVAAITPDGHGLPAGNGSVATGSRIYDERCANCHDTPAFPQLWGGVGSLNTRLPEKSVGSYWPYATTVYDYIARAMPPNARVRLRPDEIYALTALILSKDGIVPAAAVLDARSLPLVRMPNRAGFFSSDGRPDT